MTRLQFCGLQRVFLITQQVKALHRDREEHGEIDVSLRHMDVEAFQHQGKADEDQKRQRQHFHRRMTVNKIADGSRGEHHHPHRDHHRRHHDEQMIRQADGGDH
ncbi:Uncharacterised protein [Klebsiella pneumoniae]|nr:Uncharacterised protein [Klebsiella pneumoniae]